MKTTLKLMVVVAAGGLTAGRLWADETADQINSLKQQIQELDRKLDALERRQAESSEQAGRQKKAESGPVLGVGEKGFFLKSADGDFDLRLRALVQADSRFYFDNSRNNDGFLIRRARPELVGTVFKKFDFRLMTEFAGSSPSLMDAWLNWRISPWFQVLAGKSKVPVGLERYQSRENNLMTEFGYPTSLVPNRDLGIALHGEVFEGALDYYLGAFNGTTDGGTSVSNPDDDESLAGRVFARPFAGTGTWALQGLGFGIGGTYGNAGGTPANFSTVGQQTFFTWGSGVVIDGMTWRVDPQLYYYCGPFGLLGEYAISSQRLRKGASSGTVRNSAWAATASWVLTGEDATFNGVKPAKPADPFNGQWGAWQIAARVTELDVDDAAFPVFSNPGNSASRARSYGGGVNWYLNSMVRISTDYNYTVFHGAPIPDEHALISRVQFRF
jgi:phosphate-selective porin OprO and OprP